MTAPSPKFPPLEAIADRLGIAPAAVARTLALSSCCSMSAQSERVHVQTAADAPFSRHDQNNRAQIHLLQQALLEEQALLGDVIAGCLIDDDDGDDAKGTTLQ